MLWHSEACEHLGLLGNKTNLIGSHGTSYSLHTCLDSVTWSGSHLATHEVVVALLGADTKA